MAIKGNASLGAGSVPWVAAGCQQHHISHTRSRPVKGERRVWGEHSSERHEGDIIIASVKHWVHMKSRNDGNAAKKAACQEATRDPEEGTSAPSFHVRGRGRSSYLPSHRSTGRDVTSEGSANPAHSGRGSYTGSAATPAQSSATVSVKGPATTHGYTDSASRRRLLSPEPDLDWEVFREDLPTGPLVEVEDNQKIFKLAKEVSRLGKLMTAGRDVHDIHTTLYLVSYWDSLQPATRQYTQHRLRQYLAATRGWPAAIYYDTHGSDEFIPAEPGFWAGYQQPRPVTAQQGRRTSRPATRRGRGSQK
jgi:hypothetical protein